MPHKDPITETLKQKRIAAGLSVLELADILKIPADRLYKWDQGKSAPKFEDRKKVDNWLAGKNFQEDGKAKALAAEISSLEATDNGTLLRILDNLSAAHREISESNNKLADNEKMILMKMPTAGSEKDNGVASPKVMSGILVAMAKIASGTRWHSEDEALRELGRLLSPQVDGSKKTKDSRVG